MVWLLWYYHRLLLIQPSSSLPPPLFLPPDIVCLGLTSANTAESLSPSRSHRTLWFFVLNQIFGYWRMIFIYLLSYVFSMFKKKTAQCLTFIVITYWSIWKVWFAIWGFLQIFDTNLYAKKNEWYTDKGKWMEQQRHQRIVGNILITFLQTVKNSSSCLA